MDAETHAILTDIKNAVEWLRDSMEDIDGGEQGGRKSTARASQYLALASEALRTAKVDVGR